VRHQRRAAGHRDQHGQRALPRPCTGEPGKNERRRWRRHDTGPGRPPSRAWRRAGCCTQRPCRCSRFSTARCSMQGRVGRGATRERRRPRPDGAAWADSSPGAAEPAPTGIVSAEIAKNVAIAMDQGTCRQHGPSGGIGEARRAIPKDESERAVSRVRPLPLGHWPGASARTRWNQLTAASGIGPRARVRLNGVSCVDFRFGQQGVHGIGEAPIQRAEVTAVVGLHHSRDQTERIVLSDPSPAGVSR
jgi:hypothetical protein